MEGLAAMKIQYFSKKKNKLIIKKVDRVKIQLSSGGMIEFTSNVRHDNVEVLDLRSAEPEFGEINLSPFYAHLSLLKYEPKEKTREFFDIKRTK